MWSGELCPHLPAFSLSAVTVPSPEEEPRGEKVYLYMHLKQQPIW